MTCCVFYGGKGGVGKTSCAAATGLTLAAADQETLVVSTDPAHSLADAYETDLGPEPREIRPCLEAVETDADTRAERYEALAMGLAADLRSAGIRLDDAEIERLFAAGVPAGSDEIAALDLLVEYVEDGSWDRLVFDTAPTGHTLRLLELPEVMGLGLETLRSLRGQVRRIGDAAKRVLLGPMYYATGGSGRGHGSTSRRERRNGGESEAPGPEDLAALQMRLERAREYLRDPDQTEFRVVLAPEAMAISETERLVDRLREDEIPVETLVVNRVLEDADEDCDRCRSRQARHADRVETIRETFPDLAVVTLPEIEGEVQGPGSVASIADRLPS